MDKLSALLREATTSGSVLDLHDMMYKFTLDTFCQIGFGSDPGCLSSQQTVRFAQAFNSAQEVGSSV